MDKIQQRIILTALTIAVFLLLASYFLAMLLGPALFFFTPAGLTFGQVPVQLPVFFLFVFAFYIPLELSVGQVFVLTWGVFAFCFVLAWRLRDSLHRVVEAAFSQSLSKIFSNWLFVMPIIASMLFSGVVLIINLQDLVNVPTGALPTPQTDTEFFEQYLSVSYAAIIEEIGFRIVPMGAYIMVYSFVIKSIQRAVPLSLKQRFKLFLFSFLYPDGAKKMVGERTVAVGGVLNGISKSEWTLVLVTSIIFGAAHVIPGIGWEIGKFTSTFIQGFVFAVVYLAYGFQASILMHWFFNYYFYTYYISTEYYAAALSDFSAWVTLINLALGSVFLLAFTILGLKKIVKRQQPEAQLPSVLSS